MEDFSKVRETVGGYEVQVQSFNVYLNAWIGKSKELPGKQLLWSKAGRCINWQTEAGEFDLEVKRE